MRHPESGRKLLYVNKVFTMRINELSEQESEAVLNFYSITAAARVELPFSLDAALDSVLG